MANCIFCDSAIESISFDGKFSCTCPNCGKYKISLCAFEDIPGEFRKKGLRGKEYLFAGYIREMNELGLSVETITNENFRNILSDPRIPKTTMEKLDKLLLFIYRRTERLYHSIPITPSIKYPAIAYAKDEKELDSMIQALGVKKYYSLHSSDGEKLSALTLEGLQRAESLKKEVVNSTQCFVALWFSQGMMEIYHQFIKKAVEDAGYQALNISEKQHNEKICDHIIAEIRKSKFIIADFTGRRGGVYFEAGFAHGLGLPVIWTCKAKYLNKLHFDVNHYNFIVWETGEELQKRLTDRIQATII